MAVYVATCAVRQLVKIGYSDAPAKLVRRILALASEARQLKRGAVSPVTVIGLWPLANFADEQALHAFYAPVRAQGEWYRRDPALLAYAAQMDVWVPAFARECDNWAEYAALAGHWPLCPEWVAEERAIPLRQRIVIAPSDARSSQAVA